ncbi:MAG: response regulator [Candidatus Coatesbacteria bacterium]|nr:response regulator [Candidatus Coatesbacteria bacterium]
MQKIDKLESIGLLAGGIAHDFNNFLMAIWGNIDIAKASIDNKETVLHRLFESEKALAKAEELTNQLLTFSKGGIPIKKKLLSNNFMKEAIDFVLHGSKVKSFYEFNQTYQTLVDESQLSRVLSNIALNAVEAMDEGGTLNIAVDNFDITNQIEIPLEEGKYVKISIKDNGTGISEKHLSRIFDPYFTTKAKGSGLGLAVAFSIIKYHNGYLKVESKKGAGSTFSIYLPASLDTKEIVEKSDSLDSSSERILVMDDDDMVRDVLGIMIKTIGYDVDFAIDGEEALKKVEKAFYENKGYCLIIMDLTIPGGMGGKEAVTLVKKNYPAIKVIVSSGYSKDPVMADFRKYGFDGMLAKPFNHNMLENALNEILSKKRDQPR